MNFSYFLRRSKLVIKAYSLRVCIKSPEMSNYINFNRPQSNGSHHDSFTDVRLSNFAFKNKMVEGRPRPSDIPRTESQTILSIMNSGSTDSCSSLSSELNHKAKNLSLYGGQEDRTKFVLVLYCGGTIGMKNRNGGKMKELNTLIIFLNVLYSFNLL